MKLFAIRNAIVFIKVITKYSWKDHKISFFIGYTLKVNLMTSNKVINGEQKNKHKIMKDVARHIALTDYWKEQICIINDALMSQ